ncbi:MAG: acetyl-CoA carboxylase biotin carboxyl carrier protein subunit [Gemmatimonadales bacterium]
MKYFVSLLGRDLEVEVEGESVRVQGRTFEAHLRAVPGTPLRHLLLGDRSFTLPLDPVTPGTWEAGLHGERWRVEVMDERTRHIRSLTGMGQVKQGPPRLTAPMPGLVVKVEVKEGQQVLEGAGLVVLEAMKMQNELRSPVAGVIGRVLVRGGQAVEKGLVLVEFGGGPD